MKKKLSNKPLLFKQYWVVHPFGLKNLSFADGNMQDRPNLIIRFFQFVTTGTYWKLRRYNKKTKEWEEV